MLKRPKETPLSTQTEEHGKTMVPCANSKQNRNCLLYVGTKAQVPLEAQALCRECGAQTEMQPYHT